MARLHSSRRGFAALAAMTLAIVACSGDTDRSSTSSDDSTMATNTPRQSSHSADGILELGLLVPTSDPNAPFGPQLIPVVEAMVRILNSFGGFEGRPIELVVQDEGPTPESAQESADFLATVAGVDMVIGPYSAINAPAVLDKFISAGIGVCSPSVSSPVLDAFDDAGLFLRTGAQDTSIIASMVELAVQSGSEVVSVAYPDDPYGRNLSRLLRSGLRNRNLTITSDVSYTSADDDISEMAAELVDDSAPVELVIANPTDGERVLNQLVAMSRDSEIITNDLATSVSLVFPADVPEDIRPRVLALAPAVTTGGQELLNLIRFTDPEFPESITQLPPYAVNTVDCLMLSWISALVSESDNAEKFKDEFTKVANDGSSCSWVSDCKIAIDERVNIDYKGINELTLDDRGVPVDRLLLLFEYDSSGNPQLLPGTPKTGITG